MNHERIPLGDADLVADSYARVENRAPALAVAFFTRLFEIQPGLRRVFPNADADKRAFAATFFRFVVLHLQSEDELHDLLERFGERGLLDHVTIAEIDAIGLSILGALRELEGEEWSVATSHAWETTYAWTWVAIRGGARTRQPH